MVPRWPEPGLPTLTRLPLRSSKVSIPASARATTVKGSGWTENTARRSSNAPCSSNCEVPSIAWNCQSDWATPNSSSPERTALML